MANSNNNLKAYVRFDGTGRVIAGSLILQRFKPKVGNWQEIDINECCNYVPSTTTTTSSSTSTTTSTSTSTSTTTSTSTSTTTSTSTSTTTTTTTAAPFYTFSVDTIPRGDSNTACANYGTTLTQMFSNVATLVNGSVLYTDSSLTSPFSGVDGSWFGVNNNGTTSAIGVAFSTGVVSNITPC